MTAALPKIRRKRDAQRHGAPSQVLSYGAFVLGVTIVAFIGLSFVTSSHAFMGAAVIVAVPFIAVLMLALMQYFDRRDR